VFNHVVFVFACTYKKIKNLSAKHAKNAKKDKTKYSFLFFNSRLLRTKLLFLTMSFSHGLLNLNHFFSSIAEHTMRSYYLQLSRERT